MQIIDGSLMDTYSCILPRELRSVKVFMVVSLLRSINAFLIMGVPMAVSMTTM